MATPAERFRKRLREKHQIVIGEIHRTRAGHGQRSCGAYSWWARIITEKGEDRASDIGSQYPITELLKSEEWEIDPEHHGISQEINPKERIIFHEFKYYGKKYLVTEVCRNLIVKVIDGEKAHYVGDFLRKFRPNKTEYFETSRIFNINHLRWKKRTFDNFMDAIKFVIRKGTKR